MSGPLKDNLLFVRATPKASRNGVTGLYTAGDGNVSLSVKVTAAPDKGKANKAVIEVLAKAMKIPKTHLTLVRGDTDRNKIFQISGNTQPVEALIASLTHPPGTGHTDGEDH